MFDEQRSVTASVECRAVPAAVIRLLGDPLRLPEWAPPFADRVERVGDGAWRVSKGDRVFDLRVEVDPTAGTVDYLRALGSGGEGGAFLRVVPRPVEGSVITMTAPVPEGVEPSQATDTLHVELALLRELVDEGARG